MSVPFNVQMSHSYLRMLRAQRMEPRLQLVNFLNYCFHFKMNVEPLLPIFRVKQIPTDSAFETVLCLVRSCSAHDKFEIRLKNQYIITIIII